MESEGPYTIDSKGEIWWILFDGEKVQTAPKDLVCNSALICSLLNTSYAEGRKAMEKDFQELLEMMKYVVDRIGDSGPFGQMHALEKLMAWKKARGIE